jgi:long-chain acyl-CoA synthetase
MYPITGGLDMNIATNLVQSALHFPSAPAVFEGNRQISFSEFHRESSQIASSLVDAGIRPGDHVALCAPNSYAWLAFYFGVLKAGAIAVTFSHLLKRDELNQIITDCQPRGLLLAEEKLSDIKGNSHQFKPALIVCKGGDIDYDGLLEKGDPNYKLVDRDRDDTAAILYTGGTTGTPKGALLSHENIQTSIFNVSRCERSTENDRALCFLPLNHVFAQIHIMNATVFSGGGLVVQPGFDLDMALEAIADFQITKFYAVPTIYIRLLALENLKTKINSIRYCFSAAASMATEVVREWKTITGLDIHEAYGMTESASMVTFNHYYRHVVGSVGTPANLVEVQIRDFDGNVLEQEQQGEICIRGPNICRGYLNSPQETKAAFWGPWLRSGDIGFVDAEGYLFIVDRLKDMIITGGENVYPREVEELLYTRAEVLECAVVGLPDREYGERVTAFIVPAQGQLPVPEVLKAFLEERLAGFKVPKAFVVVDELPKSNAGKLLKRKIREAYGMR